MEENLSVKVNFYNENIDLSINPDYDSFLQKIIGILKISPYQLNSFTLNYIDEEGDNILLSTLEDYKLFYQQVKEGIVNKLIIENKDEKQNNNNIDLNYNIEIDKQEQMSQSNTN